MAVCLLVLKRRIVEFMLYIYEMTGGGSERSKSSQVKAKRIMAG